jgi:hypothetical protein
MSSQRLSLIIKRAFFPLSPAEVELADKTALGAHADCLHDPLRFDDPRNDPTKVFLWPDREERTVRATLLELMCLDPTARGLISDRGISLSGAEIVGTLDLSNSSIPFPLVFAACSFPAGISLTSAQLKSLSLTGSSCQSLAAARLRVERALLLDRRVVIERGLQLAYATIGGNLDLHDSDISNNGHQAIECRGLAVKGDVLLSGSFSAVGAVSFSDAQIEGSLDCRGGSFVNHEPDEFALHCGRMNVRGSMTLSEGFHSVGEVSCVGITVGHNLDCAGSRFDNPEGRALTLDGAKVSGGVFLNKGFQARGEVRLHSADVRGDIDCNGGRFRNPSTPHSSALTIENARVGGNVWLSEGFRAFGCVNTSLATVLGSLICDGARLSHPGDIALIGDGVSISGTTNLARGFISRGEVRFTRAHFKAMLACSGGRFRNVGGYVLSLQESEIDGSILLRDGFSAIGETDLAHVRVLGGLDCSNATFCNPTATALDLTHARITGTVSISPGVDIQGTVKFTNSNVGVLADSRDHWQPASGVWFDLNGLTYNSISEGSPTDASSRIEWIRKHQGNAFLPQPYTQLAAVLTALGHSADATGVLIARERIRRSRGGLSWLARQRSRLSDLTISFGYRPWKALSWMIIPWIAGAVIFKLAWTHHAMQPTESANGSLRFCSPLYSLDTLLPIADLGQKTHWLPNPSFGIPGYLAWLYRPVHILLGWTLMTLFVAGLTGVVKRD